MSTVATLLAGALALATPALRPQAVSFPTADGGTIHADLYGEGEAAVVLVHGARFDKQSWRPQARRIARAGFRVLAIDLRGYGESTGGTETRDPYAGYPLDVLGAVRYLRRNGATTVSVIGASLGGWAAARASVESERGEIDRLVLLAHSPIDEAERMMGRKLFVVTENDPGPAGTKRLP
ncbi:MAG: alpha/beta hydrolase, partial [Thermoanaerobaculia bacterium]|nr:alpha/beta hydrolase [Thermoanaerobaculia bacterium]